MRYEPSFERTDVIDALCMEIAELVGMLSPQTPLSTSPTLRREVRIQTIYSSLVIEGNKLDERAVSAIIDGKRVLGDRSDTREGAQEVNHTPYRADKMPRPNDPCPWGSGKTFKNCHGRDIR